MRKQYDQILASMLQPLPIESAPKDGTVIDVFGYYEGESFRVTDVSWNDTIKGFMNGNIRYTHATHWLPIPQVKGE